MTVSSTTFARRTRKRGSGGDMRPAAGWRSGDVRMLKEGVLGVAMLALLAASFMPRTTAGGPARWVQLGEGEDILLVAGLVGTWVTLRWLFGLPMPTLSRSNPDLGPADTSRISVPDCSDGGDGGD